MIRNKNNVEWSDSIEQVNSINNKEEMAALLSQVKSCSKSNPLETFQDAVAVSNFSSNKWLSETTLSSFSSPSVVLQKLFGYQKSDAGQSSGLVIGYSGVLNVKQGGIACNHVIVENGLISVESEGKASEILVTRDGKMTVKMGGLALLSQAMSLGVIEVYDGGILIQPLIAKEGKLIATNGSNLLEPLFANGAKIILNTAVTIWYGRSNDTDNYFYIANTGKLIENLTKADFQCEQFIANKKLDARCAYNLIISHPESKLEILTNHYSFKTKVYDGVEAVFGKSHESIISHSGQQIIYSGGLSNFARVRSNGKMIILDKGSTQYSIIESEGYLEANFIAFIKSPRLEGNCTLRLTTDATIENGCYLAKPLKYDIDFQHDLIEEEKTTQNELTNLIFPHRAITFDIRHIGKTKLASNIVLASPQSKLVIQPGHASEHTHVYAGEEKVLGTSNYTQLLGALATQTVYGTAYTSLVDHGATLAIQNGGIIRHAKIKHGKLIQHENSMINSVVVGEKASLICVSSSARAKHIDLQNSSIVMGELDDASFQNYPPLAYEIDLLAGKGQLNVRWDANTGKCDCIIIDRARGHFELVVRTTSSLPKKINVQQFIICRQGDASFTINLKN